MFGLFRDHVFKVKVLDIMSSMSGFTEGQVRVVWRLCLPFQGELKVETKI